MTRREKAHLLRVLLGVVDALDALKSSDTLEFFKEDCERADEAYEQLRREWVDRQGVQIYEL